MRKYFTEQNGFSLLLIILIILGLGLAGLGAAKLIGNVNKITQQQKASIDLTIIQDSVRKYYSGHADLGLPGTPGAAEPVPVVDLGLENKYLHDNWGTSLQYYRGRTTAAANVPSITEVIVDGVQAAGYVLSFGPNQVNDSAFTIGGDGTRSTMIRGGDDILLPLSVTAEAIKITDQELRVLSSKSCALHIATNTWFDNWSDFLARFGLADTYQYDPWDSDYVWDTDHWVSDGPDWTASTTDDLLGPYLTIDTCPYTAGNSPIDPFNSLTFWGPFPEGIHLITDDSGNSVLNVSATTPLSVGSCQYSLAVFRWDLASNPPYNQNCDLDQAWTDAGHFLSYDAQIKVKVLAPADTFAAGIAFRITPEGPGPTDPGFYGYGVSFTRTAGPAGTDQIPNELTPTNNTLYIVLWQRTDRGCNDVDQLAYKTMPAGFPINMATILVRVEEAATVSFNSGGTTPIITGDTITGQTSGATGKVSSTPYVTGGSWGGGNAIGWIQLTNIAGTFQAGEVLLVGGQNLATAQGFRSRDNYIKVYYGLTSATPTPGYPGDTSPLNENRLANPIGVANWPPADFPYSATEDFFTIVQWDSYNSSICQRLGTYNEIIRSNTFVTSDVSFPTTRPEIGLHTWGQNPSGNTFNNVYFDDFSMQPH